MGDKRGGDKQPDQTSLAEFAETFWGGVELSPWQRELLEHIERANREGARYKFQFRLR